MEETYPLALALFDFVPVVFFLIGAIFLVCIATRICGFRCRRLAIIGSLLIFLGGFLKAIWKLLYTTGVGDFQLISEIQFVLVAPGFLVLLIVVIWMMLSESMVEKRNNVFILAMAAWKIPLLVVMTFTSMGVMGLLAYYAFRLKAKIAVAGFIVALLCLVGMGAMASGEQTLARQSIEQSINSVGQLGFMIGSIFLFKIIADYQTKR
jgi:hypothetical protein